MRRFWKRERGPAWSFLPKGTIILLFANSKCNACGRGCDPEEKSHITWLRSGGPRKGCGIEFTHVWTGSTNPVTKLLATRMRPDLVYIDSPAGLAEVRAAHEHSRRKRERL
jgi:hypothetical protein